MTPERTYYRRGEQQTVAPVRTRQDYYDDLAAAKAANTNPTQVAAPVVRQDIGALGGLEADAAGPAQAGPEVRLSGGEEAEDGGGAIASVRKRRAGINVPGGAGINI
jgi:hypothetical protein